MSTFVVSKKKIRTYSSTCKNLAFSQNVYYERITYFYPYFISSNISISFDLFTPPWMPYFPVVMMFATAWPLIATTVREALNYSTFLVKPFDYVYYF